MFMPLLELSQGMIYIVFPALALLAHSTTSLADQTFCGQYNSAQIGDLKFSTNAWGADGTGGTCIEISNTSSLFTVEWNYTSNPTKVHSYPNIGVQTSLLPLPLSSLASLKVSLSWYMGASSSSASSSLVDSAPLSVATIDVHTLKGQNVISDVAVDIFLDSDQVKATSTTLANYEVMIWLGTIGGAQPFQDRSLSTGDRSYEVAGMKFTLSTAKNQANQTVYTWLAPSNITSMNGTDFAPLLIYLYNSSLLPQNLFMGTLQFGSETFHADKNVTFQVWDWDFEVAQVVDNSTSPKKSRAAVHSSCRWCLLSLSVGSFLLL